MYNLATYPFPISFSTFIPISLPNKSQNENRDWVRGYINAFVRMCAGWVLAVLVGVCMVVW